MVVGDNPDKLMEKYSKSLKVKPYIKYKYLDADKLKSNAEKVIREMINNSDKLMLNDFQLNYFKERLKAIISMTSFEYYRLITQGMYYDENGNALTEENPYGKWDKFNLGKNFSYPLKLKDGKESYQAKAKDIDWASMNMNPEYVKLFETIWDLVVNDNMPSTKEEETLKANWENKKNYLSKFKSVEEFVSHNCAYWNYAYLDDRGWTDVDDDNNESAWINGFYDRFIKKLKEDDLVTIFEYSIYEKE